MVWVFEIELSHMGKNDGNPDALSHIQTENAQVSLPIDESYRPKFRPPAFFIKLGFEDLDLILRERRIRWFWHGGCGGETDRERLP